MIKSAECYKTPAGTVRIKISQRIPKFMIAGQENFYIDTDRQLFPVSLNRAAYVPVVSGTVTKSFATGKLFRFCKLLLLEIRSGMRRSNKFTFAKTLKLYWFQELAMLLSYLAGLDNYELNSKSFTGFTKEVLTQWVGIITKKLIYNMTIRLFVQKGLKTTHPKIEIVQNNDSSTVKRYDVK